MCYGAEATAKTQELIDLAGGHVQLEKDVSETDKYDRLLRYVWLIHPNGKRMLNEELVKGGYAQSSTYAPDVKYKDLFVSAQREAREQGRGLWGACGSFGVPAATKAQESLVAPVATAQQSAATAIYPIRASAFPHRRRTWIARTCPIAGSQSWRRTRTGSIAIMTASGARRSKNEHSAGLTGNRCGRRVEVLYGGHYFLCRHCHNLAYESTRERDASRYLRKAQKIRMKLGGSASIYDRFPEKPKGMHW